MHILIRLADRAFHGGDEVTSWTLARELFVSEAAIIPILDGLKAGGFVIEADSSAGPLNQGLFLARESSTIVLADAIKSVELDEGASGGDPRVDRVLAKMCDAAQTTCSRRSHLKTSALPRPKLSIGSRRRSRTKPTTESVASVVPRKP